MVRFMRHDHRDENEPEIITALTGRGYKVKKQKDWDLVVANPRTRCVCLLEVKHDGKHRNDQDRRDGGLTKAQIKLHIAEGWAPFIPVVRTIDQAVAEVEARIGLAMGVRR
ncbi:MAG: hypothetical protein DRR06_18645 [Gammaproteobacteria bacterium]|nr:MAG: hypothetical protein DRR06_18645 [Gammaproteobacteria bacterium]